MNLRQLPRQGRLVSTKPWELQEADVSYGLAAILIEFTNCFGYTQPSSLIAHGAFHTFCILLTLPSSLISRM